MLLVPTHTAEAPLTEPATAAALIIIVVATDEALVHPLSFDTLTV